MMEIIGKLGELGIIPVVKIENVAQATSWLRLS